MHSPAVDEGHSRLWTFSLAVYGDQECLDLQDRHGIDVNLLLFCAFVGAVYGATLSEYEIIAAAGAVKEWNKGVVSRLRAARRALKRFACKPAAIGSLATALREDVKAAELESEQIEQAMLESWLAPPPEDRRCPPAEAVAANIRGLLATCASAGPAKMPEHLITAALAAAAATPTVAQISR